MGGDDEKPVYINFSCERARLEYTESRGGMNTLSYSLRVENLRADGDVVAERLTIPLTPEKYHILKERYEDSTAEEMAFGLLGKLEAIVRPVCLN